MAEMCSVHDCVLQSGHEPPCMDRWHNSIGPVPSTPSCTEGFEGISECARIVSSRFAQLEPLQEEPELWWGQQELDWLETMRTRLTVASCRAREELGEPDPEPTNSRQWAAGRPSVQKLCKEIQDNCTQLRRSCQSWAMAPGKAKIGRRILKAADALVSLLAQVLGHFKKQELDEKLDEIIKNLTTASGEYKQLTRKLRDSMNALQDAEEDEATEETVCAVRLEVEKTKQASRQAGDRVNEIIKRLADLEPECPAVLDHIKNGLPRSLLPLWRPGRSRAHFEDLQFLESPSRNRVFRATYNGKDCAVKEFPANKENLKACFREACLLRRMQHPEIVQIEAIFFEESVGGMPDALLREWAH